MFGAKLASLDDSAARAVQGVKAVLRVPLDRGAEGVAVIAEGYWQAKLGRDLWRQGFDVNSKERLAAGYRAGGCIRVGFNLMDNWQYRIDCLCKADVLCRLGAGTGNDCGVHADHLTA